MSTFFPAFPVGGVILIAFFLVLNTVAQGQQLDGVQLCGTEEPAQSLLPPSESLDHCFTVQTIFDNCSKIWLRVNIHFFLDDNCEGTLDPLGIETISPEKAYEVAESLINSAELIAEETDLQPGVYQQTKSTVALQSGVYALVAQFNGGIYSINLVKS